MKSVIPLQSSSDIIYVNRKTTYQTASEEGPDFKVDVTVTAVEDLIVNANGGSVVVGDSDPEVIASAINSSKVIGGIRSFADKFNALKTTIETVAATVVKISLQLNFDPAIALGIAKTETQLGILENKEPGKPAWKESSVNPMAWSRNNAAAPDQKERTEVLHSKSAIKSVLSKCFGIQYHRKYRTL